MSTKDEILASLNDIRFRFELLQEQEYNHCQSVNPATYKKMTDRHYEELMQLERIRDFIESEIPDLIK